MVAMIRLRVAEPILSIWRRAFLTYACIKGCRPRPRHHDMVSGMAQDQVYPRRFGIGEWYGKSFAAFKADKTSRLKKPERDRLAFLADKKASGAALSKREDDRLSVLQAKKQAQMTGNKPCPFKGQSRDAICTKVGGICSLRVYEQAENGVIPVDGDRGNLRALCPHRFHENLTVFRWAGKEILDAENPLLVGEVGFLESSLTVDSGEGADVGRIDMVLVKTGLPSGYPMQWCALEIQAVYFSGPEMEEEFSEIIAQGGQMIFPKEIRRPDYRSSGPKRLMPQLQIKVPTLRRWGKKMAVVVDRSFFKSMGKMETVSHVSNGDIVWIVVDFIKDAGGDRFTLVVRVRWERVTA